MYEKTKILAYKFIDSKKVDNSQQHKIIAAQKRIFKKLKIKNN